jgi:hypothetical protein
MIRERKYIRAFQRAKAVDESSARTLEELHLAHSPVFDRMIVKGFFIRCGQDRYYLNVPVAEIFQANRNYFMRIFLLILVLLLLAFISGKLLA